LELSDGFSRVVKKAVEKGQFVKREPISVVPVSHKVTAEVQKEMEK